MPKNGSDVILRSCWRVSYNPERVFSTLQVTEMGFFYRVWLFLLQADLLLSTPGGSEWFSCGEIKGKEGKSARENQAAVSFPCAKIAASQGVFLVGFGARIWIPEPGLPCGTGMLQGARKKKQNRNCFGSFGIGAASWTLLGSSCVLQRIPIQFLCVSKEFQHFSSVSSWWKSSHLISE